AAGALRSMQAETRRTELEEPETKALATLGSAVRHTYALRPEPRAAATCSFTAPLQYGRDGLPQDSQVEPQTPRPDILAIQFHAPLKRGIASRGHLPQSCDAWSYIQPGKMFQFVFRHIVERMGTRAD